MDVNGNLLISVEDVEKGVGRLEWDGLYDTDSCFHLSDCDEQDLMIILKSNEYNKESFLIDFFDNFSGIVVDWEKFDGDFEKLISDYFSKAQDCY